MFSTSPSSAGRRRWWLVGPAAAVVALSGCAAGAAEAGSGDAVLPGDVPAAAAVSAPPEAGESPQAPAAAPEAAVAAPDCTPAALPTLTAGVLTVAADRQAGVPWFSPSGGGVDPAVVSAVSAKLGYSSDRLVWVSPAAPHDVAIGAFAAEEAAPGAVTAGYAPMVDVVVSRMPEGASYRRVGVVAGSTGEQSAAGAGWQLVPFEDAAGVLAAARAGAVDAGVVSAADAADPVARAGVSVVGRLRFTGRGQPPQVVMVVPGGGQLAGCVSSAVDRLRVEGTLGNVFEAEVGLTQMGRR